MAQKAQMKCASRFSAMLVLWCSCATKYPPLDGKMYPHGGTTGQGVFHLHCTYTEPYCGGAEPDPSDYPRAQPWSGRMFIRVARPDSTGRSAINDLREPILDTIQMNGQGHGYLQLPTGNYLFLDRDRVDDHRYQELLRDHAKPVMYTEPIDTACMRQWLHGPFGVFTIASGDTLHLEYPMHGQCPWYATPCLRYNGPLPP